MTTEHLGAVREPIESELDQTLGTILLLGEDNPQSSRPEYQLYPRPKNCAGNRLQELVLELPEYVYLAMWRTNLCTPSWNSLEARKRMWLLLSEKTPWTTIVTLGRKVSKTLEQAMDTYVVLGDKVDISPFSTVTIQSKRIVSLPHPSGRCREWNDQANFARAQSMMRLVAPAVGWGGALL